MPRAQKLGNEKKKVIQNCLAELWKEKQKCRSAAQLHIKSFTAYRIRLELFYIYMAVFGSNVI